jgi:hypothetical protein
VVGGAPRRVGRPLARALAARGYSAMGAGMVERPS